MEWKIGEIKQINGEWYQCLKAPEKGISCDFCSLFRPYFVCPDCFQSEREDNTKVIFKKLEKVGEPFTCNYYGDKKLITMQEYQLFDIDVTANDNTPMYISDYKYQRIAIEIKQNKEDMEEKKLNLKPFDLEAAKRGKPVCTRDGRKARIVCFDRALSCDDCTFPIVALVKDEYEELLYDYTEDGLIAKYKEDGRDLMMLLEKKEGWIKVCKDVNLYATKEEADRKMIGNTDYISAKVEWEE